MNNYQNIIVRNPAIMGGKPIMSIAILGWPIELLPASLAASVLNGARSVCEKAGIALAGGHTIDAKEPFLDNPINAILLAFGILGVFFIGFSALKSFARGRD